MRADRPSATALVIALAACVVAAEPRTAMLVPRVDTDLAQAAVRLAGGGAGRWFLRLIAQGWLRCVLVWIERALAPGIMLHYRARKAIIERSVREALTRGQATRVVVLAAGYDGLAARLAREFPERRFLEVDHPATQSVKRRALQDAPPNLTWLAADLAQTSLAAVVPPEPATLFVVEGLLMYLTEQGVAALLAPVAATGGTLVATTMRRDPRWGLDFRGTSRLVRRWLARRAEPFKFGLARDDVAGFFAQLGFRSGHIYDHPALTAALVSAGISAAVAARTAEGELVIHST